VKAQFIVGGFTKGEGAVFVFQSHTTNNYKPNGSKQTLLFFALSPTGQVYKNKVSGMFSAKAVGEERSMSFSYILVFAGTF